MKEPRTYLAARVGDRGDEYFEHFDDQLASQLREKREGSSLFVVVIDAESEFLGRFNISDVDRPEGTELGFRIAENAQGQGVAIVNVIKALEIAATRGVRTVQAHASIANPGSHRVLESCGFAQTGWTEAPSDSSQAFIGYIKDLDSTSGLVPR